MKIQPLPLPLALLLCSSDLLALILEQVKRILKENTCGS